MVKDQTMLYEKYLPSVISFITCFAKELSWFDRLPTSTQKVLIKSCLIEVLVIQDAGYTDVVCSEYINHRLNFVTDVHQLNQFGCFGRIVTHAIDVAGKLNRLVLTPVELSLLIALCLLSSGKVFSFNFFLKMTWMEDGWKEGRQEGRKIIEGKGERNEGSNERRKKGGRKERRKGVREE